MVHSTRVASYAASGMLQYALDSGEAGVINFHINTCPNCYIYITVTIFEIRKQYTNHPSSTQGRVIIAIPFNISSTWASQSPIRNSHRSP